MNAQPGSYLRKTVDCFTRPGAVQLVNEDKEQLTADYLRCVCVCVCGCVYEAIRWTLAQGRRSRGCGCQAAPFSRLRDVVDWFRSEIHEGLLGWKDAAERWFGDRLATLCYDKSPWTAQQFHLLRTNGTQV